MGHEFLIPVVFCGGESRRMGMDKGLLPAGSVNWLQNAIKLLSALPGPILISIQEHQLQEYAAFYPIEYFVTDNLQLDVRGPLCGLLTIHEKNPEADFFVLACDMLFMKPEIIQLLYDTYCSAPGHDAYLFINHDKPEPLCGIYCSSGLAKIYARLKNSGLKRYSMKYLISQLDHHFIPVPGNAADSFKNFNSPADLTGH